MHGQNGDCQELISVHMRKYRRVSHLSVPTKPWEVSGNRFTSARHRSPRSPVLGILQTFSLRPKSPREELKQPGDRPDSEVGWRGGHWDLYCCGMRPARRVIRLRTDANPDRRSGRRKTTGHTPCNSER